MNQFIEVLKNKNKHIKPKRRCSTGSGICLVCNDRATNYNFGVVTCESCKAFFRRNALKKRDHTCHQNDNCQLDPETRRFCAKCRLKKCFEVGMNPNSIQTGEQLHSRANSAYRKAWRKKEGLKRGVDAKKVAHEEPKQESGAPSPAPSLIPPSGPHEGYLYDSPSHSPYSPYGMFHHHQHHMGAQSSWPNSPGITVAEPGTEREDHMVSIPREMLWRLLQSHPKYSCRCSCSCGKYNPDTPIVHQIDNYPLVHGHGHSQENRTLMQLD